MADYGTLFQLILAALTFVIVGMVFIVYLMIIGEREKKTLRAKERWATAQKETQKECVHFFGYLSQYPANQTIPDECFGCTKAIECMNAKAIQNTTEAAGPPQQQ